MSNSHIAHNTLLLYFRLILIMLVSLYTVRVVLNVLGAQDYGIYDVVGGVVIMFAFVNNAMADGTQRFLNFALGQNNEVKTKETFSASILIHFAIALVFVVIAETIGLWFVNSKLNIPEDRHFAAMIVYQITIFTTILNIIRVPFNAVIIAYEKISFFAWVGIVEALLKLLIVYFISVTNVDRLILYATLISLVSALMLIIYKVYCNINFTIAHYSKVKDNKLFKELVSFSGWSLFGATANVSSKQGTNIVLNMFTNVAINAAMGIANQVNNAIYCFASNFQTAFKPRLIQLYAAGEKQKFIDLIFKTSKFSFLLLYFIVLPLSLNVDFVLNLWLKNPPDNSALFVNLILICSLIDALNAPLWISAQAIGNIRKYQIVVSSLVFLNLPLCIVAFMSGANPECVLKIRIILLFIITIWRVNYLKKMVAFPWKNYFTNVLLRCLLIFFASYSFCRVLYPNDLQSGIAKFFFLCIVSCLINLIFFVFVGANKLERIAIIRILKDKFKK